MEGGRQGIEVAAAQVGSISSTTAPTSSTATVSMGTPFVLNMAPGQTTHPSVSASEWPSRHRHEHGHRDVGRILVTGTCKNPFSPMVDPSHVDTRASSSKYIPKLEFPLFDGDNPRLWKDK